MRLLFFILFPILALSQNKENSNIFDAVRYGDLKSVKQYVEINKNVLDTLNSHNHSLLILAAYYEQLPIVEYISSKAKNLNHNSGDGTALAAAVVKNNLEVIMILLNHKVDVNLADVKGISPLMYAIIFQNIKVIKLLIEHGADKKQTDNSGKSCFEYAILSGNQQIINLLKN